ncbi:MAG TPA: PDZ domain-containing protein [Nocardioidaceae bacterium]|jgi:PDZ domain-containing protein
MSRRTVSSILACVLLVVLFAVAALLPVPYVTMSPGPTINVLGESQGKDIIDIAGHKTYPAKGQLRLTTVSVTGPSQDLTLVEAMTAWFDQTRAVYPRDVIYDPRKSVQDVQTESSVEMVGSQDTAIAAALSELGYHVPTVTEVLAVTKDAPADGKLRVRDKILSVNGKQISDAASVSKAVQRTGVGKPARFVVRRDGKVERVTVRTKASADDPDKAIVGVVVGEGYRFPFDVSVNIDDQIGGPSAGLIFSLGVYDELTPGSLTGGAEVAGTGTISPDGSVGPIGGIQQKIVAAADAGAKLFLVPPANCKAALGADVSEDEITLVRAPSMHSAITSVKAFAEDKDAKLPKCG